MNGKTWIVSGVCGVALMASATVASAANWTLNASEIATGVNSTTVNITDGPTVDITVKAGRTIQGKTTHSPFFTQTRGTSGGVGGEIDVADDFFDLDFDTNVFLTEFRVAWLFPDGEYGDQGNEVAIFQTFDASGSLLEDFFLAAESKTTANLYTDDTLTTLVVGATVSNIEIAQDGSGGDTKSGGVWSVAGGSIFGTFDTLRLFGGDDLSVPASGAADSDFSFVSAAGAAVVPVPAALPLMLTALAGFGLLGWRRKRNA